MRDRELAARVVKPPFVRNGKVLAGAATVNELRRLPRVQTRTPTSMSLQEQP